MTQGKLLIDTSHFHTAEVNEEKQGDREIEASFSTCDNYNEVTVEKLVACMGFEMPVVACYLARR